MNISEVNVGDVLMSKIYSDVNQVVGIVVKVYPGYVVCRWGRDYPAALVSRRKLMIENKDLKNYARFRLL
jgi:uncharacterized protein (UPF0297 family)